MEKKLNKIVNRFNEEQISVMMGMLSIVYFTIMEIFAIAIAVIENNYLLLSVFTYIWVLLITECFVKKYLFRRLVEGLLKIPLTSRVIFFVATCVTMVFSWKYFVSFLLCMVSAIMYGEFCRLENAEKNKEEFY